ncbi:Predicted PurR-regulated permease PerM (PerM) [Commensalibacter communis]|uniref:Predicted PurR-regulated permease PerM (PerM) n=2 Tax=Commensalibacter communis TaxID=2972786 RepID=A0A9W4TQR6_9PROT|nr:Predicted PurR-regulated permease PerM (PerM) [Commensalibacter communis]CAI3950499.1 Predicted PurR-regulated permease PerM (PerM) [Commensalibacter communis]CAI3952101.1 Predicted PurR-regulated permease PerM (PerM) [Commensalibacter communis]CAI3952104.1 Predicted PurR-regulated permease PerM (PerM) [Commensalibacter communis]CAI3952512.1 Predicted PurR-regulated permease PerM (PerM) [Commensalibacter communis]
MSSIMPSPTEPTQQERFYSLIQSVIIAAVGILAIWLIGDLLMIVFAATLTAIILKGLASILRKYTRLPYWVSLTIVIIVIISAFLALMLTSGPQISEQIIKLKHAITTQVGSLRDQLHTNPLGSIIMDYLPNSVGGGGHPPSGGASLGSRIAGSMTGFITSVFGVVGTVFVIFIAGLYFAASPTLYGNGLLRLFPSRQRPQIRKLLLIGGHTLWSWTAGQSVVMLVVGSCSFIGLSIIGIPLALALGVVAGLANFIPYIGAIIGAVPAILIGLSQGRQEAILVLVLYCVIQFVEGNVISPLVQNHAVRMPPGITILSQTVFGTILGMPGLILASPLTAAILAIMDASTPKLKDEEKLPPLD